MNRLIATLATIALCGLFLTVSAKEMVLTTLEGKEVLLKEDNTWVYKDGKKPDIESDFTVPIDGGRFVLLTTDGTWGYVKEEVLKEREMIPIDSVVGRGHSVHIDVAVATAKAQNEALIQVIEKTKNALRKAKIDPKKVSDCVKRVEKDVDKSENFKKGTGWDVSIVITLDRGSLLAVAECAQKDQKKPVDSTAGAGAGAAKGKK